jgi:hypothetical protein
VGSGGAFRSLQFVGFLQMPVPEGCLSKPQPSGRGA